MTGHLKVKIGFVPSYRGWGRGISDWCAKMRADTLAALGKAAGVEVVAPSPCPHESTATDAARGCVSDGVVRDLDQAEAIAEYFGREKVAGLLIGALNFGDERSAAKVAEKLGDVFNSLPIKWADSNTAFCRRETPIGGIGQPCPAHVVSGA